MQTKIGKWFLQTEQMKIKAISLHQPWASWIAQELKTIETRTWPTKHRGDLLIVSSRKPEFPGLPLGCALCIVDVVDCRPMKLEDEFAARSQWFPGRWAWVLSNIRKIEKPFRVRGRQGMYEVEIEE
ncbi:hypothetical protein ES703_52134 [subsurface metagenome]